MVSYNGAMDIHSECAFCGKPVTRRRQAESRNVRLHFCNMQCKSDYQRQAKPVTREWLVQKYQIELLDCVMIGRLVSRDPKSVWNWLKDFDIPRRPRGSDARQHFIKGEPNLFEGRSHTKETRDRLRKISIAQGRLPYKKENGPPWKGVTGAKHPNWKGGLTPERQAFYASDEWKVAVKAVWARANAYCERCGKHHNEASSRGTFHVHHIISFMVRELRAEVSNLVLLCSTCHRFVHSRANTDRVFIKEAPCL